MISTNRQCKTTKPRPRAYSLWSPLSRPNPLDQSVSQAFIDKPDYVSDYTSWPSLTNKTYSNRHLAPSSLDYIQSLPKNTAVSRGNITALFMQRGKIEESRSSSLFMFFAQWFTDSLLRIDSFDHRKNTSNHNIDLCQIYGRTEAAANALRTKAGDGKLRSKMIKNGQGLEEECLDYLGEVGEDGVWKIKERYQYKRTHQDGYPDSTDSISGLPYTIDGIMGAVYRGMKYTSPDDFLERQKKLYATGLERGNSSIGYVAISTLFMREHNRICTKLGELEPDWDDERLFQTARNINIVILMKLVIQDYINHIAGHDAFKFDPSFAEKEDWYRTPWISIEFDLLYRWHGLIREKLKVKGREIDQTVYRFNNGLFENMGIGAVIDAASKNPAGEIGLYNVPDFMEQAEYAAIKKGRDSRLACYNDYRDKFKLKRLKSFADFTNDRVLREKLEQLYGNDIDKLEYVVGIFGQKHKKTKLFGDLMLRMVSYDAFTQIYTNPLLSKYVYNSATFTDFGLDLIEDTDTIHDLVKRNVTNASQVKTKLGMK